MDGEILGICRLSFVASREQRLFDCSLQTGPRFCLPENAFPVRRISGVSRSVLGFLINDDFIVERKRLSSAPAMGVSQAVSGFLTAYDHLWRGASYHNMKGLVRDNQSRGRCQVGPNGATNHDHLTMDAARNLKFPKTANCFVCT
jgi:hypothetical protein